MKQKCWQVVFFLGFFCVLALPTNGLQAGNRPGGVNGISWGQSLDTVGNMTPVFSQGEVQFFLRKGEKLTLGGADLGSVWYGFLDRRFMSSIMHYQGRILFHKIREALEIRHGDPDQHSFYPQSKLIWTWPDLRLTLIHNPSDNQGRLSYCFLPLAELHDSGRSLCEFDDEF